MTDSKFLDSSAWIHYLEGTPSVVEIIDGPGDVKTSVVSLYEVKRKLLREHLEPVTISRILSFMEARSGIVDVSREVALLAADESARHRLHTTDSLIWASAKIEGMGLLTSDSDFKGMKDVEFIG